VRPNRGQMCQGEPGIRTVWHDRDKWGGAPEGGGARQGRARQEKWEWFSEKEGPVLKLALKKIRVGEGGGRRFK